MKHVISASLFVLSCALAQPASAQPASAPIEDKPCHGQGSVSHSVFSNDYLIVLNVNIPPAQHGYHTIMRLVSVN